MDDTYNLSNQAKSNKIPKIGSFLIIIIFIILFGVFLRNRSLFEKSKSNYPAPSLKVESKNNADLQSSSSSQLMGKNAVPSNLKMLEIDATGNFSQLQIVIAPKTALMWKNLDETPHEIIFLGEKIKSSKLQKGDSFTRMFNEVGLYRFSLSEKPEIIGTVNVK